MAVITQQSVSSVITPTFSTPTTSDTFQYQTGQWLHVKVGGTATTITLVIPGNQVYSGVAVTDLIEGPVTSQDRIFRIPPEAQDSTGVVNVLYSQTTAVTAGLFKM
jgi:hypothetical protein